MIRQYRMKAIPQATTIALTIKERIELEALAGSRKSEARMHDRARILLLAASGTGSRAALEVGCTPGPASKWRVRFAANRMAGLSETGDRGAESKYGPEHGKRILAVLDQPPPAGYSNWTAPLLARELVDILAPHGRGIRLTPTRSWIVSSTTHIASSSRASRCAATAPVGRWRVLW